MRTLCKGVNTGVRSSSAVNAHSSAGDALKRAFDVILHRVAMRLALPAGEWRAVVSDDQFQSSRLVGTLRCGVRSAQRADPTHGLISRHSLQLCSADFSDRLSR